MNKSYRKAIIAGNWKMNKVASEVKPFMEQLRASLPKQKSCETVLCVPFPLIPAAQKCVKDTRIVIGAQDVSEHKVGAYTGEVSSEMLRDLGVRYCIVGHSERRGYLGETDMQVNGKVRTLVESGIIPIICVGENEEQREKELTTEFVSYQVKAAMVGLSGDEAKKCVIAYEPIWAIGTGKTATAQQAQEVCGQIRIVLRRMFDARTARSISILYGGSMNAGNCDELLSKKDVDGGLIGGASLKPEEFIKIITATAAE